MNEFKLIPPSLPTNLLLTEIELLSTSFSPRIIIIGIYLFGPVWLASKMKDKLVFSNNLFYKNNEKVINIIAGFFYVLWLISPGWIINQFI